MEHALLSRLILALALSAAMLAFSAAAAEYLSGGGIDWPHIALGTLVLAIGIGAGLRRRSDK